jgi:predicted acetyltransferase
MGSGVTSRAAIRQALIRDKPVMNALLQNHMQEMRAFGPVQDPYPYFDVYWTEPTRWPYLIEVGGEPIGFAMVNRWSPSGRGTDHAVAEFYVAAAHRRQGHGIGAARQILHTHPGQWELWIFEANKAAQAFWPAAIANIGARSIERFVHQGNTVQRFVVG